MGDMTSYELLAIFPGTVAETEINPLADKIKVLIEQFGAAETTLIDLGKSRLAYPMRQIRYGYFRIYYFQAEPDRVPDLEKKLNLDASFLRVIMRKYP